MTNPNPASTLSACPFDGGACAVAKGYSTSELPWSDDGGDFFRVYCAKCQSRQLFHRTEAEAIAAWNRRASTPSAAPTAQVAERQPLTGWSSVEDRLPEEREKAYQIVSIAKKLHGPGNYEGQGIKAVMQDWNVRNYASNYTHWMPLPEAPGIGTTSTDSGEGKRHE